MIGRPIPQGFVTMQPGFVTTASGASFSNPTSITGLQLWYDFTSATYLLNGSDVPPSDTNTIKQATDRSTNANNATQGTDGNRPVWVANLGSGYGGAQFTTDDQLNFGSSLALGTGAFTIAVLGTRAAGEDPWITNSDGNSALTSSSATVVRVRTQGGTNRDFTVANMGTSGHVIMCSRTSGGAISVWVDGTASASNTITDAGAMTLARLGVRSAAFLDGYLGQVCVYNADLTSAQKNSLGSWMAAYFGVTWNTIP